MVTPKQIGQVAMSKRLKGQTSDRGLAGSGDKFGRNGLAKARPLPADVGALVHDRPEGIEAAVEIEGEDRLCQVKERVWLIMAIIGVALSDHPLIRHDRINRHLADRARKALFDLHSRLEQAG